MTLVSRPRRTWNRQSKQRELKEWQQRSGCKSHRRFESNHSENKPVSCSSEWQSVWQETCIHFTGTTLTSFWLLTAVSFLGAVSPFFHINIIIYRLYIFFSLPISNFTLCSSSWCSERWISLWSYRCNSNSLALVEIVHQPQSAYHTDKENVLLLEHLWNCLACLGQISIPIRKELHLKKTKPCIYAIYAMLPCL